MSYLTSTFLLIVTVATIIVMGDASASDMQKPLQLIASTPKRELKNPFAYSRGAQKRIMALDRSCHGGGAWLCLSPIRFGSMAMMTTHCFH
jgi:hypothetical protein